VLAQVQNVPIPIFVFLADEDAPFGTIGTFMARLDWRTYPKAPSEYSTIEIDLHFAFQGSKMCREADASRRTPRKPGLTSGHKSLHAKARLKITWAFAG